PRPGPALEQTHQGETIERTRDSRDVLLGAQLLDASLELGYTARDRHATLHPPGGYVRARPAEQVFDQIVADLQHEASHCTVGPDPLVGVRAQVHADQPPDALDKPA